MARRNPGPGPGGGVSDIHRVLSKLVDIETRLEILELQNRRIMAKLTDVQTLVTAIDEETNTIAAKVTAEEATIQALKDQIAAGGAVTEADLEPVAANLRAISDRLTAVGQDPANPIPPATV